MTDTSTKNPHETRHEHVRFESAQVTDIKRVFLVGKTKEVALFREHVEPDPPENFHWVYSYGGPQDANLDPERDRVADVFVDDQAIQDAGWHCQAESDLLAVLGSAAIGIPANHIPRFTRLQARRRWSEWQAQADAHRACRRVHPDPDT